MARMYEILRTAFSKGVNVLAQKDEIFYLFKKEVLAVQKYNKSEDKWTGDLYKGDDIINVISGTKEEVAKNCIEYSGKMKIELENRIRFGTPSPV